MKSNRTMRSAVTSARDDRTMKTYNLDAGDQAALVAFAPTIDAAAAAAPVFYAAIDRMNNQSAVHATTDSPGEGRTLCGLRNRDIMGDLFDEWAEVAKCGRCSVRVMAWKLRLGGR